MSASDNPEYIKAMNTFGDAIGIAFQIRDDILDYEGNSGITGKPVGGDIKEKKITLPLIYSLNKASRGESSRIIKIIKNGKGKDNIKNVISFVREYQGIEYALKTAGNYSVKAKESLSVFPDSQSKLALEALVDFITDRKN
jgi:octaprenyl-diphosphate synthase